MSDNNKSMTVDQYEVIRKQVTSIFKRNKCNPKVAIKIMVAITAQTIEEQHTEKLTGPEIFACLRHVVDMLEESQNKFHASKN